MEPSIFRFILKYSKRDQILLVLLTAASMPFIYLALEVPKIIINQALSGRDVPDSVLGVEVDQVSYLFFLCGLFLLLIVLNGGLKYILNVYRGVLGERMLRRLRYDLFSRVLRFPLPHFKKVSQGEIIPMITAETEPLGGFVGDSIALPAFQGGLLITYLLFIFNQDPLLGAFAVSLYPLQMYLIPKLQRRVNQLAKERVLTVRKMADRIGDSVSGITEIHALDTSQYERADISARLGHIFRIRYELYKRKFFIKFLNNFLNQITPFFFYSVGGYFVIQGELTLGALVAVIAAFKDLAAPWNELLKFYQITEDVRVKYAQVVDQFHPENMLELELQEKEDEQPRPLEGVFSGSNIRYSEDQLVNKVDGAAFRFELREHVAVLGKPGTGQDELALLMARLVHPNAGRLELAGLTMDSLPEAITGRRLAYVGQGAHLFAGTVRDNLYYGLKHRPQASEEDDAEIAEERTRERHNARITGNSEFDVNANWINYGTFGVNGLDELDERALMLLDRVGLADDIYRLGLRSKVDPEVYAKWIPAFLQARAEFRVQLAEAGENDLVEPLDESRYHLNSSVAENLLFGTVKKGVFNTDDLASHPYVIEILERTDLLDSLTEVGRKVAETMIDLFADLPPDHEFFERFSFISSDDLPVFQGLVSRVESQGIGALNEEERGMLLGLSFRLTPARHRLGFIDEPLQARLLEARTRFGENLPSELEDSIEFFNSDRFNSASTLQDNILFGKRAYGQAGADARLEDLLCELVEQRGLRTEIMRIGLSYEVGIAGSRLSLGQRQKLALARCLIKQPEVLIVNGATAILDRIGEQQIIRNVREFMDGGTVVWVLNRPELAQEFDKVLLIDNGKVVDAGSHEELSGRSELLRTLQQNA